MSFIDYTFDQLATASSCSGGCRGRRGMNRTMPFICRPLRLEPDHLLFHSNQILSFYRRWVNSCMADMACFKSCILIRTSLFPTCKLTFDLLILKVVSESRVTCANFSLPRPFCSRLRPDVRDKQTSDRQTTSYMHHRLMPPPFGGGGITCRLSGGCVFVSCIHLTN